MQKDASIPLTHQEFEPWFEANAMKWPKELHLLGLMANKRLWQIANNAPSIINALQEDAPNTWKSILGDLTAFAEAYGRWKQFRQGKGER